MSNIVVKLLNNASGSVNNALLRVIIEQSLTRSIVLQAVKEWEADNLGLEDHQHYGVTNYAVDIDQDEEAGYMDHFFKEVRVYMTHN